MDPITFYDLCAAHDWYYTAAESRVTYQRGAAEAALLQAIARKDRDCAAILAQWEAHKYSGAAWGTPVAPRPLRPQPSEPLTPSTFPGKVPAVGPDQSTLF